MFIHKADECGSNKNIVALLFVGKKKDQTLFGPFLNKNNAQICVFVINRKFLFLWSVLIIEIKCYCRMNNFWRKAIPSRNQSSVNEDSVSSDYNQCH